MSLEQTLIGEAYVGEKPEAAHVNVVLGRKGGPVETAWVTALAAPRSGHVSFLTILQPNLPVKPLTLFVNKAPIESDGHGNLTWGPAQAGVARGVAEAVAEGIVPSEEVDDLLLVAAVWIDPRSTDERRVYEWNATATRQALEAAVNGLPLIDDVIAVRSEPWNAFYRPE